MKSFITLLLAATVVACGTTGNEEPASSSWRTGSASGSVLSIWTESESRVRLIRSEERPVLHLRCADGVTDAFLAFETQVSAQPRRVQWSIDGGEPVSSVWTHSGDWKSLFIGAGGRSIAFARALETGQRLTVQADLGVEGVKSFSFNLAGFVEASRPLSAACEWSPVP